MSSKREGMEAYMSKTKKKQSKSTGGRPTALTPEVQKKLITAIESGAFIETAVVYAGIRKSTFYEWLKRANEEQKAGINSIYTQFSDALKKALAGAELKYLNIIGASAMETWQAAAWTLERRWPHHWSKNAPAERS